MKVAKFLFYVFYIAFIRLFTRTQKKNDCFMKNNTTKTLKHFNLKNNEIFS